MKRSIKMSALQTLLTLAGVLAAAGAAQSGTDTTRVIVAMKPGAAANARAAVVAAKGVVKHEIFGTSAMAVEVPTAALAGMALVMISFPAKAKPGAVPDETLFSLAFVDGVIAAIPGIIAALCYARYTITRERYEATKAALAARRAAKTA